MDHRVEALEVSRSDLAQVLGDDLGMGGMVVEQPAAAVEAGVEARDVMPGRNQLRAHDNADIAVGSGQQNTHVKGPSRISCVERRLMPRRFARQFPRR